MKIIATTIVLGGLATAGIATVNAQPRTSEQCSSYSVGATEQITDCYFWDGYTNHHTSQTICQSSGITGIGTQCRTSYFPG
jgi:hypothetical protein